MKDDCISREAVLESIKDWHDNDKELIERIEKLPSVQPERKTGHWNTIDECSNAGTYCSCCHKRVVKEGWSKTVKKSSNRRISGRPSMSIRQVGN